jgi:hypothetical protein
MYTTKKKKNKRKRKKTNPPHEQGLARLDIDGKGLVNKK